MSFIAGGLSIIGKLSTVLLLLGAFLFGMGGVLFLALRSPEVQVPQVVGKDRLDGEKELESLGLKIKKRTDRYSEEKPNTILEQSPIAGENVKAGQTVYVVVARADAESGETAAEVKKETVANANNNANAKSAVVTKPKANRNANTSNRNSNSRANNNANGGNSANDNSSNGSNANGGGSVNSNSNSNRPAPSNANRTNTNRANTSPATTNNNRTPGNANRNTSPANRTTTSGNARNPQRLIQD